MDPNMFIGVEHWLVIRAALFAVLFGLAGIAAMKTNTEQRVSVQLVAATCFMLFVVNLWMLVGWIDLFYL